MSEVDRVWVGSEVGEEGGGFAAQGLLSRPARAAEVGLLQLSLCRQARSQLDLLRNRDIE